MKKFFYRVQQGDNLFAIAKRFNCPVSSLITENRLVTEISSGDIIKVVCVDDCYSVKPLQTYCSLATLLNVTEQSLKDKNPHFPYLFYGLIIKT